MNEIKHSCVDCGTTNCSSMNSTFPTFCVSETIPEEIMDSVMTEYQDPTNQKIMIVASEVEDTGYCEWPRVQEIVEFAKRMGYKKLGIATCVGLIRESRMLARILRSHGFEVYGIACKAGMVRKDAVGIQANRPNAGCNMCNPILQAKMLEHEGTELNLVVGLCVGHDSLFYKYSSAVTTTLVTKDRVTGHNPAAALYNAESYYKKKLFGPAKQE